MFSQEELEKKRKKNKNEAMENMLDLLLAILPNNEDTDLIKSQHCFQKIDREIVEKATNKELTKEQKQQLTSFYNQMKNVLEDILNK